MGADGHVKIYDYEKVRQIIPDIDRIIANNRGNIQKRELFGQDIITTYYDNQLIDPTCIICGNYGCNVHYEQENQMDIAALIDSWEVWT